MEGRYEFGRTQRMSEFDDRLWALLGSSMAELERDGQSGSLTVEKDGIDLRFDKAPWVVARGAAPDPEVLHLAAVFFFAAGIDGHRGFIGALPNAVRFGDALPSVAEKMAPHSQGVVADATN